MGRINGKIKATLEKCVRRAPGTKSSKEERSREELRGTERREEKRGEERRERRGQKGRGNR